jgi:hypothetical protein
MPPTARKMPSLESGTSPALNTSANPHSWCPNLQEWRTSSLSLSSSTEDSTLQRQRSEANGVFGHSRFSTLSSSAPKLFFQRCEHLIFAQLLRSATFATCRRRFRHRTCVCSGGIKCYEFTHSFMHKITKRTK